MPASHAFHTHVSHTVPCVGPHTNPHTQCPARCCADDELNYPAVLETAADIAKGMFHLHMNNILHADLKVRG